MVPFFLVPFYVSLSGPSYRIGNTGATHGYLLFHLAFHPSRHRNVEAELQKMGGDSGFDCPDLPDFTGSRAIPRGLKSIFE